MHILRMYAAVEAASQVSASSTYFRRSGSPRINAIPKTLAIVRTKEALAPKLRLAGLNDDR